MSEQADIKPQLEAWPFQGENNVRIVAGRDGRELLQVRLPLGLEQYELEGRPDGMRPKGHESLLEYHQTRLVEARAAGQEDEFSLSMSDCAELFSEAMLYYYRYLHLFQARLWSRTGRDTARNLRLFDFVRRHAEREEDQRYLEQWRPYLLRMHAMAKSMLELEAGQHDRAIEIVRMARLRIEALPEMAGDTFKFERRRSLMALKELAAQIEQSRPRSELEQLEQELNQAIETQAFEQAAKLRDRIRALKKTAAPQSSNG